MVLLDKLERTGGGLARVELVVADQEFRLATVEPACLVEFGDGKLGSANLVGCLGAVGAGETGKPILIVLSCARRMPGSANAPVAAPSKVRRPIW
jgi:hypothetical protein